MFSKDSVDHYILIKLCKKYHEYRYTILWFLTELYVINYGKYKQEYIDLVLKNLFLLLYVDFFELTGCIANNRMIHHDIYFVMVNRTSFWNKASNVIYEMRKNSPRISNFEIRNNKRMAWRNK